MNGLLKKEPTLTEISKNRCVGSQSNKKENEITYMRNFIANSLMTCSGQENIEEQCNYTSKCITIMLVLI